MCICYINSHLVQAFQQNFTKSSIFVVKLLFSIVSWMELSEILLKFHKFYWQGYIWPAIFWNFRKIHQTLQILCNLEGFPAKVLLSKHHIMGKIKVLLCIYVSFQG